LDNAFRSRLSQAGASVVAYIPNNAYLVRASAAAAQVLAGDPQTRAVLAYEPYYKLKGPLLKLAVQAEPLEENSTLKLLLFAEGQESTLDQVQALGAEVVGEPEPSPFGPVVRVRPARDSLAALARLAGVQELEPARVRVAANDLSRAALGVAADPVTPANYLGLTGSNVLVNVNDTGVDTNHPDLAGRVFGDRPQSGVDTNGHGTHVAGIIASSGSNSLTVTNAEGSVMPPVAGQFRGQAPGARIYSMLADLNSGPLSSDTYLQEQAARTNAFISNISWHYLGDSEYDLGAASYDAAVRDALPRVPGSQPVLYVFAAGNSGGGDENGTGGNPDSIQSPGTAKNVITVGALEQGRNITNEVW
jgi:subtilisin family serine protease